MADHTGQQGKRQTYYGIIFAGMAMMMGVAAVYQPLVSVMGVAVFLLLLLSIHHPERVSYVVLGSTAISINYIINQSVGGMEILSLYKLGILILLIPCMLQNGLRVKLIYPIAAFAVMLFLTFSWRNGTLG
ncbi:hypothetical protein [Paenibacillus sp. N3.4]|uniref:hypothetical protein n=1 Tax=Paenibacillus sp. N3.4 TaxID=2603222 RepID=UPI0021C25DF1|nr:hypothetical protein [Paenibacillus sp. N3.4]